MIIHRLPNHGVVVSLSTDIKGVSVN
jgi:hypothetical protein